MTTLLWMLAGALGTLALVAGARALQLEQRAVGRAFLQAARDRGGEYEATDRGVRLRVYRVELEPERWDVVRLHRIGVVQARDGLGTREAERVAGSWWTGRGVA